MSLSRECAFTKLNLFHIIKCDDVYVGSQTQFAIFLIYLSIGSTMNSRVLTRRYFASHDQALKFEKFVNPLNGVS